MPQTDAPSNLNMLYGAGSVYFDRFDADGLRTGFRHMGDVSQLLPRNTDQTKEHFEHMTPARSLYATALDNRTSEVDITFHEMNLPNLALATAGDEVDITQSAATVTDESLATSAILGRIYQTANRNISAVVVKQGVTTLTVDDDYRILDASAGLIQLLTTGAGVAGDPLTVDYSAAAIAAGALLGVSPWTQSTVDGQLLFIGNPVRGPKYELVLWHVAFSPQDLAGLIGEDFAAAGLTGKVLSDLSGDYGGSAAFPSGRAIAIG